jgi:cysteine-rich repeat protein
VLDGGESCDDGNTTNGDGCDASCHVEPFDTTAAVQVSGALGCTTAISNAGRKIAVDGSGTVYVVMSCGAAAEVVVSTDRGHTFSDPVDLAIGLAISDPPQLAHISVATGPTGVAYVVMMLTTGPPVTTRRADRGSAAARRARARCSAWSRSTTRRRPARARAASGLRGRRPARRRGR